MLFALIGAGWIELAGAAATPNVCVETGVSSTVAAKTLGAGATAQNIVNYQPNYCSRFPASGDGVSKYVSIFVYPKSQFQVQIDQYLPPTPHQRLAGLGSGAIWYSDGNLLFKKGAHTVHIGASFVVAKAKLVALAHVVYAQLR